MDIIFKTERLNFKKFNLSNFDDFYLVNKNPKIMAYFFGKEKNYRECMFKYNEMSETQIADKFSYWAVYDKKNKFIGQCGFLRNQDTSINLCYAYLVNEWGKGYATEAAKGAIKHLFTIRPDVDEITAMAFIDNVVSIHILTKIGFKYFETTNHSEGAVYHYKMTRDECKYL